MEFSEDFELNRLSKSRHKVEDPDLFNRFIKHRTSQTLHTIQEPSESLSMSSEVFPLRRISTIRENQVHSPVFEKDTSYLRPQSERISLLTRVLKEPEEFGGNSPVKHLNLIIFFFRTMNNIRIGVPLEITASDTIIKALLAYSKTEFPRLPHGLDSQGYDLWIADEETFLPDTDYTIDPKIFVNSLGVKTFCVCEKPGFRSSIFQSTNGSSLIIKNTKPGTIHTRFFFENSSTVVAIKPEMELREVLILLWKKFYVFGDLNEDGFEFRVFVEEIGHECALDMGLKMGELKDLDIRLYRKVLADTPVSQHRKQARSYFY